MRGTDTATGIYSPYTFEGGSVVALPPWASCSTEWARHLARLPGHSRSEGGERRARSDCAVATRPETCPRPRPLRDD